MEIASQENHDIPIPLNTTFGNDVDDDDNDSHVSSHDHIIHHNHHNHHHHHHQATNSTFSTHNNNISSTITHPPPISSLHQHQKHHEDHHTRFLPKESINNFRTGTEDHHHVGYNININVKNKKKNPIIKYKECLKNHAAAMGGNALDGCGEFMPNGEENSIEALICSACNCHRNFHRKEIIQKQNLIHKIKPQQMIMPIGVSNYNYIHNLDQSNDLIEETALNAASKPLQTFSYNQKKRFRTKFSQEQKEKMLRFAEKIEWKLQREEDCVVQRFCEEIGVKRKVLKVWMHNNKHNHFSKNMNNINLEDDHTIN